eukprot:scaffold9261_cov109-Cylindrotheca_fusiformis.AAC.2
MHTIVSRRIRVRMVLPPHDIAFGHSQILVHHGSIIIIDWNHTEETILVTPPQGVVDVISKPTGHQASQNNFSCGAGGAFWIAIYSASTLGRWYFAIHKNEVATLTLGLKK